jgi:hypothetical protein
VRKWTAPNQRSGLRPDQPSAHGCVGRPKHRIGSGIVRGGRSEAFNAHLRQECLNEHWFLSVADAQERVDAWRADHNQVATAQFAGEHDAGGVRPAGAHPHGGGQRSQPIDCAGRSSAAWSICRSEQQCAGV